MIRPLIILFLVLSVAMAFVDSYIQTRVTPWGIVSFEFIANVENFHKAMHALSEKGQIALGLSLGLDFLYLFVYSSILFLILNKLYRDTRLKFFHYIAYLVCLAGALDAVENMALIQLLFGAEQSLWAKTAYWCAAIKFSILLVCLIVLAFGGLQTLRQSYKR